MEPLKYTPGPWESFGTSNPTKAAPVGVLDGKRNIRVCDVGQKGMPVEEINANASLIAAAPDLYEAAKCLVRAARQCARLLLEVDVEALEAAIAKAESNRHPPESAPAAPASPEQLTGKAK